MGINAFLSGGDVKQNKNYIWLGALIYHLVSKKIMRVKTIAEVSGMSSRTVYEKKERHEDTMKDK